MEKAVRLRGKTGDHPAAAGGTVALDHVADEVAVGSGRAGVRHGAVLGSVQQNRVRYHRAFAASPEG
jgi:hypothetical protein